MNPVSVNRDPEWPSWDWTLRLPEFPDFSPFPSLHLWTLGELQRKGFWKEYPRIFSCTLPEESGDNPLS